MGIVLTTVNQLNVICGATPNFVVPFMVSAWGCSAGAASRARSASLAAEVLDQGEDDALVSVLLEAVAGVREPQHAIANLFSKSCCITFLREGNVLQRPRFALEVHQPFAL